MGSRTAGFVLALGIGMGAAAAQAGQVVVGQVAPLSGLDANQGRAYGAGMQLAFNAANKAGGINGNTVVLVRKDDGGRAEATLKLTQQLIAEDKPVVLAGYFGIANIDLIARSGILEKENIALVGYRAAQVRPETTNLFNVRASLRDELFKISEHLSTVGIKRMAIVHEQGPGTVALMTSASEAAQMAKATLVGMVGYPAGTADVAPQVQAVIKVQPQVILLIASGAAAAAFIDQYRAAGGTAQLIATSGVDMEQLAAALNDARMQGVAISQVMPSPYKMSSRIAKEFTDAAAKADKLEVPVSYAMIEGYVAGKVILEALRRQGKNPTREGTIHAMGGMYYELGGYSVSYRPEIRAGSRFVELTILGGKGKLRQ